MSWSPSKDAPVSSASKPRLTQIDWGVIIAYCAILTSLTLYTQVYIPWVCPALPEQAHWTHPATVTVYITGEVEVPGEHTLKVGSTRGDLLAQAKPLETADLRRLKTSVKLKQGQLVEVPKLETVTVTITGEVETPITLVVPKGTTLHDIQSRVTLTGAGDPKCLEKRRRIKDGETIVVRKKRKQL